MIAVILDTNVVHRDPWLASEPGQQLLQLAAQGKCVVVYPQVVIDELRRQRVERARKAHADAAEGLAEIRKAGVDVKHTETALASVLQRIESDIDSAFTELMSGPGVLTAPVPQIAAAELLRRDLDRRRPFVEIEQGGKDKKKSAGFRDVLIWETVLEIASLVTRYELILFATSDNGFKGTGAQRLHPDLVEDLNALDVSDNLVDRVDSIPLAKARVENEAEKASGRVLEESTEGILATAVDELRGSIPSNLALVAAATDALYGLEGQGVEMRIAYSGDYDYPDFVKFTVPGIEGAVITSIDQTSEFTFSKSPATPDVLIATTNAIITIEGGVYKADWFVEEESGVEITGELNDHYFEGSSEVEVRAIVELDIEGGNVTAGDVVLEDDAPQAGTENQLAFEVPVRLSGGDND